MLDFCFDKICQCLPLGMKIHKVCVVTLLFFLPVISFAQATPDTGRINFIKAQFASINSHISTYKKVHRDDMGQSTEGGEAMAYFDGKDLKKIVSTMYGETGKGTSEYYFCNKKLIFYYAVTYRYNKPMNVDGGGKIASTYEDRYYFDGNNIFKYINKPQKAISVKELDKEAKEDLAEAARLVKLVSSKTKY